MTSLSQLLTLLNESKIFFSVNVVKLESDRVFRSIQLDSPAHIRNAIFPEIISCTRENCLDGDDEE